MDGRNPSKLPKSARVRSACLLDLILAIAPNCGCGCSPSIKRKKNCRGSSHSIALLLESESHLRIGDPLFSSLLRSGSHLGFFKIPDLDMIFFPSILRIRMESFGTKLSVCENGADWVVAGVSRQDSKNRPISFMWVCKMCINKGFKLCSVG